MTNLTNYRTKYYYLYSIKNKKVNENAIFFVVKQEFGMREKYDIYEGK